MSAIRSLLLLTSLASATTIIGMTETSCGGGAYATCDNIGGNTCCQLISGTGGATSVQFLDLPGPSNIYGYQNTRDGGQCGDQVSAHNVGGGNACITQGGDLQYSGAAYFQASSKKRGQAAKASECSAVQRPDRLGFPEGKEFALAGLSDAEVLELWGFATSGLKAADVPAKFAAHSL